MFNFYAYRHAIFPITDNARHFDPAAEHLEDYRQQFLWKIASDPLSKYHIANVELKRSVGFLNGFQTTFDGSIIVVICAPILSNRARYGWVQTYWPFLHPDTDRNRRDLIRSGLCHLRECSQIFQSRL